MGEFPDGLELAPGVQRQQRAEAQCANEGSSQKNYEAFTSSEKEKDDYVRSTETCGARIGADHVGGCIFGVRKAAGDRRWRVSSSAVGGSDAGADPIDSAHSSCVGLVRGPTQRHQS
jgi:hypothetical protein